LSGQLALYSQVRKVLASHWIDARFLHFGIARGTVRLTGELRLLPGRPDERFSSPVYLLEQEIRRLPDIRTVFFELTNWTKNVEGQWVERIACD